MGFRQKSPAKALAEIEALILKHPTSSKVVSFVDNIIPNNYLTDFIPHLDAVRHGKEFFYEIKINVKRQHLSQMAQAGIIHLQPGIESFSDRLLKNMDKGASRIQNVYFLKWARQFGILPYWNILTGVPGETFDDYADYPALFSTLHHLAPPPGMGRIRIDRFSPYYFKAAAFGISDLQPYPAYPLLYNGLSPEQIARLAYYYTGAVPVGIAQGDLERLLQPGIDRWITRSGSAVLVALEHDEGAIVFDTRAESEQWTAMSFAPPLWRVLKSLDEIRSESAVQDDLTASGFDPASVLDAWRQRRLVLESGGKMLGLVNHWMPRYTIAEAQRDAMLATIRRQSEPVTGDPMRMFLPSAHHTARGPQAGRADGV